MYVWMFFITTCCVLVLFYTLHACGGGEYVGLSRPVVFLEDFCENKKTVSVHDRNGHVLA